MGIYSMAVVEPTRADVHVSTRVGQRTPLDRTAAGRAILAVRLYRPLEHGWSFATGEPEAGASSLAAPVVGVPGVEAAVTVVTVGDIDPALAGPGVVAAATELARALR